MVQETRGVFDLGAGRRSGEEAAVARQRNAIAFAAQQRQAEAIAAQIGMEQARLQQQGAQFDKRLAAQQMESEAARQLQALLQGQALDSREYLARQAGVDRAYEGRENRAMQEFLTRLGIDAKAQDAALGREAAARQAKLGRDLRKELANMGDETTRRGQDMAQMTQLIAKLGIIPNLREGEDFLSGIMRESQEARVTESQPFKDAVRDGFTTREGRAALQNILDAMPPGPIRDAMADRVGGLPQQETSGYGDILDFVGLRGMADTADSFSFSNSPLPYIATRGNPLTFGQSAWDLLGFIYDNLSEGALQNSVRRADPGAPGGDKPMTSKRALRAFWE